MRYMSMTVTSSKVFFIVMRTRTISLTSPGNEKICIVSFILSVGYQVTKIVILLNIGNAPQTQSGKACLIWNIIFPDTQCHSINILYLVDKIQKYGFLSHAQKNKIYSTAQCHLHCTSTEKLKMGLIPHYYLKKVREYIYLYFIFNS